MFTVALTLEEINTIIAGLAELPGKYSHKLLGKFEALSEAAANELNKTQGPDLKMVSAS